MLWKVLRSNDQQKRRLAISRVRIPVAQPIPLSKTKCRLNKGVLREYCSRHQKRFSKNDFRRDALTDILDQKPASTELTGGAGFNYEDTGVAYYLTHLLRHERAAGQSGIVTSVAVQQRGQGNPMDDLVVEFDDASKARTLGLQIKRTVTISGAPSNKDFRAIVEAASQTQKTSAFTKGADLCGFIVENVTPDTLRTLKRLIDWAKDSPTSAEFAARFTASGTAAAAEADLRNSLRPVTGATNDDEELAFYQSFTAFQLSGFEEGGALRIEIVNRLQEIVSRIKTAPTFCFSTGCAGLRATVRQPANAGPALSCSNSSAAPLS